MIGREREKIIFFLQKLRKSFFSSFFKKIKRKSERGKWKSFFSKKIKGKFNRTKSEKKLKFHVDCVLGVCWLLVGGQKLALRAHLEFFTSIFFFLSFSNHFVYSASPSRKKMGEISFHGVFAGWHRLQRTLRVFLITNWKILPISRMINRFSEQFSLTYRENLKAK